jgi:uncharacterized damage-inducible protein DinB
MTNSKDVVLSMFENIQKGTRFVLEAIEKEHLDKAVNEESATVGDLAFHISTMPLGTTLFAQGRFEKFPEVEVLMSAFKEFLGDDLDQKRYAQIWDKSCEVMLEYWKSKSADEWINTTFSHFLTRGPVTYLEGFLAMQNHMLQHRGSLTSTLRSIGVPVGLRQYWGMSPLEK